MGEAKNTKRIQTYGIILAGGGGTRLWPLSTEDCPKQFVRLFERKSLLEHAVDRLRGLFELDHILVLTSARFVRKVRTLLPDIPADNVIGEPERRNTAAAVAVAVGLVARLGGPDAVGCVFSADQLISPIPEFQRVVADSITMAVRQDAIVTLGIVPDVPATGYGYIEVGDPLAADGTTAFAAARAFVEKPKLEQARAYILSRRYLWNAGMFIWRASVMREAYMAAAADFLPFISDLAASPRIQTTLRRHYPALRATSVDFAVMERVHNIVVAKCAFAWDDVGGWLALARRFDRDESGTVCLGDVRKLDVVKSLVASFDGRPIVVIGLSDVTVVQTREGTLVCANDRLQDLKWLTDRQERGKA